jgi:hypothetical protein
MDMLLPERPVLNGRITFITSPDYRLPAFDAETSRFASIGAPHAILCGGYTQRRFRFIALFIVKYMPVDAKPPDMPTSAGSGLDSNA